MLTKIYHHITDAPIRLRAGDVLENKHFVGTGTAYGRFIFTERLMVEAEGDNIAIRNNCFEGLEWGYAISIC